MSWCRFARSCLLVAVAALALPGAAQASFGFLPGIAGFDVKALDQDESPVTAAGTHPYVLETQVGLNAVDGYPDGQLRDLTLSLPEEFLINFAATGQCADVDFHTPRVSPHEASVSAENCPSASQVGVVSVEIGGANRHFGLFNLSPPRGVAGAIGFAPFGEHVTLLSRLRRSDGGIDLFIDESQQSLGLQGMHLTLWGVPWLADHDAKRGNCLREETGGSFGDCPVFDSGPAPESEIESYLTLPTMPCGVPLTFSAKATSWEGDEASTAASTPALEDCTGSLATSILALTTKATLAPTGLDFTLEANDEGVLDPAGTARPPTRRIVIALPYGLTLNPSLAAGLGACSEADFAREAPSDQPGIGCPRSSKIGHISVEGALGFAEPLTGALYLGTPGRNPFGSLLAVYMVARSAERGLLVKSIGKLDPDPRSGRLVATFEDLPRFHYRRFGLTLRGGSRAVLVSPPSCGAHPFSISLASWAEDDNDREQQGTLEISSGEGGACPAWENPAFAAGVSAGSLSSAAGAYAPFYLRMTRANGERELTSYSAVFPPGVVGRLAGVSDCSDAAIELAKLKSAAAEAASPSCPAVSMIGRTEAGFGAGALAWARGTLYLAGPYRGAPLSVVAVTPALIGPFDLGVAVVRSAIRVERHTAQVFVDSTESDPFPSMLGGIPLHLRDIRVHVDRPSFSRNPTSCDPMAFRSILTGAGGDPLRLVDDLRSTSDRHFQVRGCSALGFKPRLSFRLKGATERGRFPALQVTYTPRPDEANLRAVASILPYAVFLEQRHIGTICTRPQFAAGSCPPRSIYGHAEAISPLFDEPLSGPVYMRASDNALPDLVASLHSRGIAIDVVGRVEPSRGRIRTIFEGLPDAPVSKFEMNLFGGRRGLLVLSRSVCARSYRARAWFVGQNNATRSERPRLKARCKGDARRRARR